MRPLGAGILGSRATVPLGLRELMIDRTCALTGAEYEWGVHARAFGAAAGLDEARLRATARRRLGGAVLGRGEQSAVLQAGRGAARHQLDQPRSCGASSARCSRRSRRSS